VRAARVSRDLLPVDALHTARGRRRTIWARPRARARAIAFVCCALGLALMGSEALAHGQRHATKAPAPALRARAAEELPDVESDTRTLLDDLADATAPYGVWWRDDGWGWVFSPRVPAGWRPYSRGHWEPGVDDADDVSADELDDAEALLRAAPAWVSDEPFGAVTDHRGRWQWRDDAGWVWRPGFEQHPAVVQWRVGDGVVGWAPPDAPAWGWVFVAERAFLGETVAAQVAPVAESARWLRATHALAPDRAPTGAPSFDDEELLPPDVPLARATRYTVVQRTLPAPRDWEIDLRASADRGRLLDRFRTEHGVNPQLRTAEQRAEEAQELHALDVERERERVTAKMKRSIERTVLRAPGT
jgi:hypothetical protein